MKSNKSKIDSYKRFLIGLTKNNKFLFSILALFTAIMLYHLLPESCPKAAKRTAFIFVIASFFWAFEILPLYATSLLIVILLTFTLTTSSGVFDLDNKAFLDPFASPVIILFFGGFMLARSLANYNIDNFIAAKVLCKFGSTPKSILAGIMLTTAFLSMWTSNTASTAIMLGIISPFLAQLDLDDPFRKGLVLGVPFSANIGGIGTPIGTPPNAIALGNLAEKGIEINFLQWMLIAIPLVILVLIITFFVLIYIFPPKDKNLPLKINNNVALHGNAKWVFGLFVFVVMLWITSPIHKIPEALIALFAACILLISRLLDRHDIKKIDWDVLILMWGGLALGAAMKLTGLAEWIVQLPIFQHHGMILIIIFCLVAFGLSLFMSNTAAANLIIPMAIIIPGESPIFFGIALALACSFAMIFPVSTPPNAMAFSKGEIDCKDMIKAGSIIAFIALGLMLLEFNFIIKRFFYA